MNSTNTLRNIAQDSLEYNMVIINNKLYVTAGAVQFRTIWIRDFGFVANILHKLDHDDIILNTIDLYLSHLVKDSRGHFHGPKCFDSMNPEWRTVKMSVRHLFWSDKDITGKRYREPLEGKLIPHMYKDSRHSIAIDSNIMIALAATTQPKIIEKYSKLIWNLIEWYPKEDGLIIQQGYSDFQDSQRREGTLFMINLLYYVCIEKYESLGFTTGVDLNRVKKKIIDTFYLKGSGIFKSQKGHDYICLLDNLLAIYYDFVPDVYSGLKKSKLWSGSVLKTPGFPTWPSNKDVHIQVAFADLNNYHNDIYWGWLMAFSGICAFKSGDITEGRRIHGILTKMAIRDKALAEIYSPTKDFPLFESMTYTSERPFTMAACYALELCNYYR